jgi:GAF domain-containing protein
MTFSIQNAGAEKGFLILENEDTNVLTIEASGSIDKAVEAPGAQPLEEAGGLLAIAVVNYVHTTKEDVVLGNACQEGMFTNDDYISRNRSKSILCAPITNKGKLVGILYLENNITTNAFTRDRL